jgi:hypothetical protein
VVGRLGSVHWVEIRNVFAVLKTFIDHTEGEHGDVRSRFLLSGAVAHDARKVNDVVDPLAVYLSVDFDAQSQFRRIGATTTGNPKVLRHANSGILLPSNA